MNELFMHWLDHRCIPCGVPQCGEVSPLCVNTMWGGNSNA